MAAPEAAPPPEGEGIVFRVEALSASGLPKAETTLLEFSGFAIDGGAVPSMPLEGPSAEPSGWLFQSEEARKAEEAKKKAEEEAANAAKDKKKPGKPPAAVVPSVEVPDVPPDPFLRVARGCGSAAAKQRLLDDVCKPLRVALVRPGEHPVVLASASVELRTLIHQTSFVEVSATLEWSKEFLAELRQEFDDKVAAEAVAAAEARAAEGGAEAEEHAAIPPNFPEPPPGKIVVRVSTAGPIGRVLCPEDFDDWAVVTVKLEGCYRLPQKLLDAGGPLPEDAPGVVAEHPLSYSLRLLGCSFDGGQLVMPAAEKKQQEGAEAAAAAATAATGAGGTGETAGEAGEDEHAEGDDSPTQQAHVSFDVGREEFVEALIRAGWQGAEAAGAAVFDHLAHFGSSKDRIGVHQFARLEELPAPLPTSRLLAFGHFLLEKGGGSWNEAWAQLAAETGGAPLAADAWRAALERLAFPELEDGAALLAALDAFGTGTVSREDVGVLALHKALHRFGRCEKAKVWLLGCCGSADGLWRQLDDGKKGTVTLDGWKVAIARLGYPESEETGILFDLLDPARSGSLTRSSLDELYRLGSVAARAAVCELEEQLRFAAGEAPSASSGASAALAAFGAAAAGGRLTLEEFEAACGELDFAPDLGVRLCFSLLAASSPGSATRLGDDGCDGEGVLLAAGAVVRAAVGETELAALLRYGAASRKAKLAACGAFVSRTFPSFAAAFKQLFDHSGETQREAQVALPRIEWPKSTVRGYRGRAWLQRLLNSLGDERGRLTAELGEAANKGSWLYFFPCLAGQTAATDFKDITDAAQASLARVSRWHHSQGFVDLRRLAAPGAGPGRGPELEFCAYLMQVDAQPSGINDTGDLPVVPYMGCTTFVKGVISLDRPLDRLCPRGIRPLPEMGGRPLVPPPPEKQPLPTVVEELEYEARRVVGKLAGEFARMCSSKGWEDPGPDHLLGHRGVPEHALNEWLKDNEALQSLAAELRPAIARMVRSEVPDGPSCGLCGNESDARYSGIRDLILTRLLRALNHDVDLYKSRRDTRLWRSVPDDANGGVVDEGEDPRFVKPAQLKAQQKAMDRELRRLAFEYETLGEYEHVVRLFGELLKLPANAEDSRTWLSYARFWMRCNGKQPEALDALRHAVSFRPEEEGASLEEAAFMACLLENHALPCSATGPEPAPASRFEAARSILESYSDKHPGDRMSLYFLFIVHAVEAYGVQAEAVMAGQRTEGAGAGAVQRAAVALEAAEAFADGLRARAAKYLDLARASPQIFHGSLSMPRFADLEALSRVERLARGELLEPPREKPALPQAWRAVRCQPFALREDVHRDVDEEDAVALQCIDMMMYFGVPNFARFLIEEASEAFGFLTPKTVQSERCKLQLIKASMLAGLWDEAIAQIQELFQVTDRLPEAHVLLGECRYRKARAGGARSADAFEPALAAFGDALAFFGEGDSRMRGAVPAELARKSGDPALHLRVASIYYMTAEESSFTDAEAMGKAVEHYKRSLELAQTAEAWRSAGICQYRQACLLNRDLDGSENMRRRQGLLRDALRFLTEANLLDRSRPQINAWLVICAVELGMVQIAKQTLRQVLRRQADLDFATALELSRVLVYCSDERRAAAGERGVLVQDGRYAAEAIAVARVALERRDSGEARLVLAQALALHGELAAAVEEFCTATERLEGNPQRQDEAMQAGRECARRLVGEPRYAALVEAAAQAAELRKAVPGGA